MNQVVLTSTGQHSIQKTIADKFSVRLSPVQILALIRAQPEAIRKVLEGSTLSPGGLELLVENIAEDVTGFLYPTEHSTPYYREYFKKKLKDNKCHYFGLLS